MWIYFFMGLYRGVVWERRQGGQGLVVGCVSSACPEHRMRCPKALRLLSGQRLPASCSPGAIPNIWKLGLAVVLAAFGRCCCSLSDTCLHWGVCQVFTASLPVDVAGVAKVAPVVIKTVSLQLGLGKALVIVKFIKLWVIVEGLFELW